MHVFVSISGNGDRYASDVCPCKSVLLKACYAQSMCSRDCMSCCLRQRQTALEEAICSRNADQCMSLYEGHPNACGRRSYSADA